MSAAGPAAVITAARFAQTAMRDALATFFDAASSTSISHWYPVLGYGEGTLSSLANVTPIVLGAVLLTAGLIETTAVNNSDGTVGERIEVQALEWKSFLDEYGFSKDEIEIDQSRLSVPHHDPKQAALGVMRRKSGRGRLPKLKFLRR